MIDEFSINAGVHHGFVVINTTNTSSKDHKEVVSVGLWKNNIEEKLMLLILADRSTIAYQAIHFHHDQVRAPCSAYRWLCNSGWFCYGSIHTIWCEPSPSHVSLRYECPGSTCLLQALLSRDQKV